MTKHGDTEEPGHVTSLDAHTSVTNMFNDESGAFTSPFSSESSILTRMHPFPRGSVHQGDGLIWVLVDFPMASFPAMRIVAEQFSSSIGMKIMLMSLVVEGDLLTMMK
jgi:hypothetical protein